MKLVVLGNGFDLANNLPTKYKNFFDYYNDKYSIEFEYISGLLHKEKKSRLTDSLSGVIPDETYSKIEDELREGIKKDFNIKNIIVNNPYISIWNLYFWHAKENLKMYISKSLKFHFCKFHKFFGKFLEHLDATC